MNRSVRYIGLSCAFAAFAGLSGCATNGDIEELRAEVAQANQAASEAAADAASAKADAAAARAAAEETNEKLDRMFKKSMYK